MSTRTLAAGEHDWPFLDKIRHLKKREWLSAYCVTGNILRTSQLTGIHRSTHYAWLATDTEYDEAFRQAKQVAVDHLESEAVRRAMEGVTRVRTHKGEIIQIPTYNAQGEPILDPETGKPVLVPLIEHEYSDVLLMFLLKAARPEIYRDRYIAPDEKPDTNELEADDIWGKQKPELRQMLSSRMVAINNRLFGSPQEN